MRRGRAAPGAWAGNPAPCVLRFALCALAALPWSAVQKLSIRGETAAALRPAPSRGWRSDSCGECEHVNSGQCCPAQVGGGHWPGPRSWVVSPHWYLHCSLGPAHAWALVTCTGPAREQQQHQSTSSSRTRSISWCWCLLGTSRLINCDNSDAGQIRTKKN